jgi:hypothetical protein
VSYAIHRARQPWTPGNHLVKDWLGKRGETRNNLRGKMPREQKICQCDAALIYWYSQEKRCK